METFRPADILREQLLADGWTALGIHRLEGVRDRQKLVDLELDRQALHLRFWEFITRTGRLAPLGD